MIFPTEIIDRLKRCRVVAGFSVDHIDHAIPIAEALLAGGIDAIELTLRTDAGIDAVNAICRQVPDMLVGVGTILTPDATAAVARAGAAFGVAPGLNRRVIEAAKDAGLPFAPGIMTPSELETAIESDCRFVKFFPAEASGGVTFLKSLAAPYKHLKIEYFPLGGVCMDNMLDYLRIPEVAAVGGSWIVNKQMVENGDWAGLQSRATEVVNALKTGGER
ncbi:MULTISPECIES: bifunctional 4-hydroxy-2-oxoglutarate aldolase/2-dehydro-3-deoxy-phosphogluconate aldolase [Crateriforma]|uniref:2-dehydro-3-deoxy-phosphogluconate aldolase n=1 Tax=Crateriforma conspicua TaxID=2527996 RepID=A0A5C6FNE3_9PLAN|nr:MULTISPECIES: bifunctional 4-hydroxy-2-oxoglutarate aldolase/2-dehydro-3-deoxy-phosphogluconate aldolase [Crateriforma]TWU64642.1 putative KHG/KDPG aldolase [Crateriforma conspicua]